MPEAAFFLGRVPPWLTPPISNFRFRAQPRRNRGWHELIANEPKGTCCCTTVRLHGLLKLLQAPKLGVEHRSRHAHPLITIERIKFVGVSIRRLADDCQPVEKRDIQLAVLPAHRAPNVPRQHLAIIQRGDVADKIARNEPKPVHVQDAEGIRIGLPLRQADQASPATTN